MNAARRVLAGALLGASIAVIARMPVTGTEAAFGDSHQFTVTVTAEAAGPGSGSAADHVARGGPVHDRLPESTAEPARQAGHADPTVTIVEATADPAGPAEPARWPDRVAVRESAPPTTSAPAAEPAAGPEATGPAPGAQPPADTPAGL